MVVRLTGGPNLKPFRGIVHAFLSHHEIEIVISVDIQAVVDRRGFREVQNVGGAPSGAGIGLPESRRMGEVHTQLGTNREVLDGGHLAVNRRDQFVLLIFHGIVRHVLQGIHARSRPTAVALRSDRTVLAVGIPVRKHQAAGENGARQGGFPLVGLFGLLVGQHGVGSHLEPPGDLRIGIGPQRVAPERGALGDALGIVEAARDVIVQVFRGAIDRHLVTLQRGAVVENGIQPVYIRTRKHVVVLARVQPDFFLEPDALGGIHHVPFRTR